MHQALVPGNTFGAGGNTHYPCETVLWEKWTLTQELPKYILNVSKIDTNG